LVFKSSRFFPALTFGLQKLSLFPALTFGLQKLSLFPALTFGLQKLSLFPALTFGLQKLSLFLIGVLSGMCISVLAKGLLIVIFYVTAKAISLKIYTGTGNAHNKNTKFLVANRSYILKRFDIFRQI